MRGLKSSLCIYNTKEIGMELVDWDFKSTGHLGIEGRDRESKTTFKLVPRESVIPRWGLIRSSRKARNDNRISRRNGP